ncbi:PhzF family phenazine biosynthesis protein [Pseudomonas corrugata]|uniref:PhzF family phenazine biosynthesis protein n=1 Tax=Pseudomonas corrugata TaxID=47879 RepID=UPI001585DF18|nr:PhzF family phenazine biosynthesis protein [Pseudomonas corrugata]MCI0994776.1 PhzF family phenazine biosynthesis protein [Pseudomonas corrugata]NUT66585.1 PhzF family phenazine biosynthesis protein [Pseudomonas corrugata]
MDPVIQIVDVFGAESFSGNPLAVIMGADALETDEMQRLARWFNLSETTFVLSPTHPDADYRVRIFSLDRELPFAGHPTLGSCHAWLSTGHKPMNEAHIVQECGVGLVAIRRDRGRLCFAAPALIRSGTPSREELNEAVQFLRIDPCDVVEAAWVDNGPGWLGIRLASAEQVLALQPAPNWPRNVDIGVIGPHASGDTAFEVRAFFSNHLGATVEDPVTGSLNASLAQWLFEAGLAERAYVAAQGTCLGRKGRIHVRRDDTGQVWIGGETRTQVEGRLQGLFERQPLD